MAASEEVTYFVVNNIPGRFRSADLRNYFSQFIESGGFACFHYRHRPELRVTSGACEAGECEARPAAPADGKQWSSCCCVVSVRAQESDRFIRMYCGNQWIDSSGNWLRNTCLIRRVRVSEQSDCDLFPYKTKAELRRHVAQSEQFTESDLRGLPELNPPALMPSGNVGTPVSVFLQLIQSCRLPPRLIRKLGLTFPKTGSNRRYGNVPYQYHNTRVVTPADESVFTAGGVEIKGHAHRDTPTTSQRKQDTPTTSHRLWETPTASQTKHDTPTTLQTTQATPTISLTKQGTPTMSLTKQGTPTISLTKQGTPTISLTKQGTPTISLTIHDTPTASQTSQDTPTTSCIVQDTPTTTQTKQDTPTTSCIIQNTPTATQTKQDTPTASQTKQDMSTPSCIIHDTPTVSQTIQDTPTTSQTEQSNIPTTSRMIQDTPTTSQTIQDTPTTSQTIQDTPTTSQTIQHTPTTSQTELSNIPTTSRMIQDTPTYTETKQDPPTYTQPLYEDTPSPPVNQQSQEGESEEELSGPDDDDDRCEEWERHEALHEDVTAQERSKERLFEEEIELKWEKGGSGLVFYTDAQFWQEEEEGDFDEQTADDWDVDMSVYYDKDGGDMDSRAYVRMRSEQRLRDGLTDARTRTHIGSFERFTKGVGRRLMEKQGWRDGEGLGNSQVGMAEALENEGQHPHCKRGFGYHGEKLNSFLPPKKPRKDFHISTVYDEPRDIDQGDELLRRQPNTSMKYRQRRMNNNPAR